MPQTHCESSPTLFLQLLLQFLEEAPVGALGNKLLGAALDHPSLMEAEGVEAHRIFGIILTPPPVGQLLHHLKSRVVLLCEVLIDECLRGLLWLECAQIGAFDALLTVFKKWTFDPSMHSAVLGWYFAESEANRFLPIPHLHGVYSFHYLGQHPLVC